MMTCLFKIILYACLWILIISFLFSPIPDPEDSSADKSSKMEIRDVCSSVSLENRYINVMKNFQFGKSLLFFFLILFVLNLKLIIIFEFLSLSKNILATVLLQFLNHFCIPIKYFSYQLIVVLSLPNRNSHFLSGYLGGFRCIFMPNCKDIEWSFNCKLSVLQVLLTLDKVVYKGLQYR